MLRIIVLMTVLLTLVNASAFASEPTRTKNIPANAVWVEADNEWELGKRNENGDMVGEWKWWLAPNGHLVCHTFFDDSGTGTMTYKRYHKDGTVSREGTYVNGKPHGITISTKSEHETTEVFNPRVDCWKAVTTFEDGYVIEEHYFNNEGQEIHEPYKAE